MDASKDSGDGRGRGATKRSAKSIIVIDDEPDCCEVVAAAIEAGGRGRWRVRAFTDPIRALAAFTAERADLVVTDLSMPWIDGEDVVAAVRLRHPRVAALLISARPGAPEAARRLDVDLLVKPFEPKDLIRVVQRLLGENGAQEN